MVSQRPAKASPGENRAAGSTPAPSAAQQNTFDLSAFRKEIERRLKVAEDLKNERGSAGFYEHEAVAEGEQQALEGVLALLPGEGETDG